MYHYETTFNGYCIEIFKENKSIAFLQGDEASKLIEELENCETNIQTILSSYDYDD